jgi:hypothetical protein
MPLHRQSVKFHLLQSKRIAVMDLRTETFKRRASNECYMRSRLLAPFDIVECRTVDSIRSNKYNIYSLPTFKR